MMHVLAPRATLIYLAAPYSLDYADGLLRWLVDTQHPDVVSFSSGIDELSPGITGARAGLQAAAGAGVTVVASTGNWGTTLPASASGHLEPGRIAQWPASDPLVTAVGGTWLHLDRSGYRLRPDTAYSDTGDGTAGGATVSALFPRPAWQDAVRSVVGSHRGVADVAMDASGCSPVAVYEHSGTDEWTSADGTSMAAPLFSALVADAAQLAGHRLGILGPALYSLRGPGDGIMDVTQGNNSLPGVPGYPATPGYDLPTGIGTVGDALPFVTALARAAS